MALPSTCDSAVLPCFHGCLTFLHRHFPPQSSLSHLLNPSLHSQQQPSLWDCFTIPKLHIPAAILFQGTYISVRGMHGCGKNCLILFPFRLPQVSCFTLSLKCLSSDSDSCPFVGTGPLLQFPHLLRAGPVLNTPVFPPSSFILLSFAWLYIFFSAGQVLLSALSWCSACTFVSEGIFLMYLWREMYSMSTYSSNIMFSFGYSVLIMVQLLCSSTCH